MDAGGPTSRWSGISNFGEKIFNPGFTDKIKDQKERTPWLIGSIGIGILTFGTLHAVYHAIKGAIRLGNYWAKNKSTADKTSTVFSQTLSKNAAYGENYLYVPLKSSVQGEPLDRPSDGGKPPQDMPTALLENIREERPQSSTPKMPPVNEGQQQEALPPSQETPSVTNEGQQNVPPSEKRVKLPSEEQTPIQQNYPHPPAQLNIPPNPPPQQNIPHQQQYYYPPPQYLHQHPQLPQQNIYPQYPNGYQQDQQVDRRDKGKERAWGVDEVRPSRQGTDVRRGGNTGNTREVLLDKKPNQSFHTWVQAGNPRDIEKKALIKATLGQSQSTSMPKCFQTEAPAEFDSILKKRQEENYQTTMTLSFSKNPSGDEDASSVSATHDFYSYDQGGFHVNFANNETFGGGFRGNGNVQEERMFFESPGAARVAQRIDTSPERRERGKPPTPTPIILLGVEREFNVSGIGYGRDLTDKTKLGYLPPGEIPNRIKPANNTYDMIAIAAQNRREIGRDTYTREDLVYHMKGFYSGFRAPVDLGEPLVIHSGLIGCGAFDNSWKMMIALQVLAMHMVEAETGKPADLILHGLDRNDITGQADPKKGQIAFAEHINKTITAYLNEGLSYDHILGIFERQQRREDGWTPKPPQSQSSDQGRRAQQNPAVGRQQNVPGQSRQPHRGRDNDGWVSDGLGPHAL